MDRCPFCGKVLESGNVACFASSVKMDIVDDTYVHFYLLDLLDEFDRWDNLSDEALENFENEL